MGSEGQNPLVAFEGWLICRAAQAVEAGEVSADLLTELRTEMERARALSQEEGHALSVQDIAKRLGLPAGEVETMLATLEAQPAATREAVLRRIVEAWLAEQRKTYRSGPPANAPFEDPQ